jgi:hypothetical protein
MAYKIQHVATGRRIVRPGQPSAHVLSNEKWIVLDALGNTWGTRDSDDIRKASDSLDLKFVTPPKTGAEMDFLRLNECPPELEEPTTYVYVDEEDVQPGITAPALSIAPDPTAEPSAEEA